MPTEVELKLWVPTLDSVQSTLVAQSIEAGLPTPVAIKNTYLDTPEQHLHQLATALRIRLKGTKWLQTLKFQGTGEQGLHQRQEWEWPIESGKVNLDLIQALYHDQPALQRLPWEHLFPWEQLCPQFTTDFSRYTWQLNHQQAPIEKTGDEEMRIEETGIEVAFDLGSVEITPSLKEPLTEIELELTQGDVRALWSLANQMAETLPVIPSCISKAERGYRLMNPILWQQAHAKKLTQPCTSPNDLIWGIEYVRFGLLLENLLQTCPLELPVSQDEVQHWISAGKTWMAGYPNDRMQLLLNESVDSEFQDKCAVKTLGQKLLFDIQRHL